MSTAHRCTGPLHRAQSLPLTDLRRRPTQPRAARAFDAVKGINLDIAPGELIALLGPSGCGKTTTLRMIAGLETVTTGDIIIGDREISHLPPAKRDIGVGFESYALYPPLSVRENLLYGLKARKVNGAEQMVDVDQPPARDERPARPAPGGPVQRPEAAGGAGPRAGPQPAGAAARRAAEPPRRLGAAAGPARAEGAAAGVRLHHDRRHPRPGRRR